MAKRNSKQTVTTSQTPSLRTHLEALGESALVELVLGLAQKYDGVKTDLIDRFSTTDERFVRLEKSIRNFRPGYSRDYEGYDTEDQVRNLIDGVSSLDDKPESALELLALIFEMDNAVMENASEYEDETGDVFSDDATERFGELAQKIENKNFVEDILFRLLPHDDYGTRSDLIRNTHEYLPKTNLKNLIERFVTLRLKRETGTYGMSSLRSVVKDLLSQYADPAYFESTLLEFEGKEKPENCFDIGKAWFEAKDYTKAFDWLQKIPETHTHRKPERLEMFRVIHTKRKDKSALADTAREIFAQKRNKANFQNLLKATGADKRESVLAEAIKDIEKNREISCEDVNFLVSVNAVDAAEDYLWRRHAKFSSVYGSWAQISLIQLMESKKRPLIATVFYRQLVDAILKAAKSKDYPNAIKYMETLKKLSGTIKDWKKIKPHDQYLAELKEQYPKRPSFWPHIQ